MKKALSSIFSKTLELFDLPPWVDERVNIKNSFNKTVSSDADRRCGDLVHLSLLDEGEEILSRDLIALNKFYFEIFFFS